MNLSFEALLIIGVLGFYIYDSAILMFSNELIFTKSYGKWSASFPTTRLRVMKKLLFFPNPLTPFNLIFVLSWTTKERSFKTTPIDLSTINCYSIPSYLSNSVNDFANNRIAIINI